MMSRALPPAIAAALLLSGAALLAGCGSSTKTGAVTSTPAGAETTSAETSTPTVTLTSTSATASATSSGSPVGANGGTPASTTRAAPEPAFTEGQKGAEGLTGAEAILHARGFTAADPSEYHEDQALRVLIGSRTGDQDQAFFFINGRFIGTDAKEPSGDLQVIAQSDTEVTLGYGLYRRGNALCCPAGGTAKVRFQLNNGLLTTLDPIPPVQSSSGAFRQ
jgi:hypothetical protein